MTDGSSIPPGLIMILAGLALPFLRGNLRTLALLAAPVLALIAVWSVPSGISLTYDYLGYELILVKADALSRLFATIFCIMGFGGALFALNQRRTTELASAFVYAGSAVGVTFCGDLISLFVFWEIMAVASTIVVWCGGDDARKAGIRYASIHFLGGVLLMAGIAGEISATGSIAFQAMMPDSPARWLILVGFLINAGAPPLSAWLPDAYPEGSWSGTVFLSAFTTKTAVFVLMRGFPGAEILIFRRPLHGILRHRLCDPGKRYAAYTGLQHCQPGRFHGLWHWHRHRDGAQWCRGPCLCTHHLQGAAAHVGGVGSADDRQAQVYGSGRVVPDHAADRDLRHRWRFGHLRVSVYVGLCQ